MLLNHLKIALRSIGRNKFHSIINMVGLAIGVSACLVIFLIVNFEFSFNRNIADRDQIFRVCSKFSGSFMGVNRGIPTAVPSTIRDQFKGIESVAAFHTYETKVTISNTQAASSLFENQDKIIIAEPEYFNVFSSYDWISGSPDNLKNPFQVVLTESKAKTYFGETDPAKILGREVRYSDSLVTNVAGIVKDLPGRTDVDFTDFISYSTIKSSWLKNEIELENWTGTSSSDQCFIKVSSATSKSDIESQLPILTKIYVEKQGNNVSPDWVNKFQVQAFNDLHFSTELGIFDTTNHAAHLPTLRTLMVVAILLLVIAAINFINLETAQAVRRAKEVGLRKVMGSSRMRLIGQFLVQSFLITGCALVLALPLAELALGTFKEFIPEGVTLQFNGDLISFIASAVVLIGTLSGLYPAFVMSGFLPALALKNQAYINSTNTRSAYLRKGLIVFQFGVAQVLIVGTVIVTQQINFILNKDLGFAKDAIVYFYAPWRDDDTDKRMVLKNELAAIPEIVQLSLHEAPPSYSGWSSSVMKYNNGKEELSLDVHRKFGDTAFVSLYDLKFLAGRNIEVSDTVKEFVINETLMKTMGFQNPQDVLGQEIQYSSSKMPVVGVVKDFNIQSLHNPIKPVAIASEIKMSRCFGLKLNTLGKAGSEVKAVMDKVEIAWKKIYPDQNFNYNFLDKTIERFYRTEQRTVKLARTATAVAIFISCLGLFGLASFTAIQRTKEIGIRKVLGATIADVMQLLSREFVLLIIVAFVLATPLAYFASQRWLEGFAYKVDIVWWVFVMSAVGAVAIALLTVSYQTLKASLANPVDSLRNE